MKYPYKITIETLKGKLEKYNYRPLCWWPGSYESLLDDINHVADMMNQIMVMPLGSLRAARWIGWILKSFEEFGYLSNQETRDLIRQDVEEGNE